jgi:threonine/homoserine/homoserine lactone efflux protein
MFGTHDLWLFVLSGLLLNLTPGPDTLYIVSRSGAQGGRAGAVAALGIGAGIFVHVLAAALGLSAILAASATAYGVVKLIGAAYLIYVGVSLLIASRSLPAAAAANALEPIAMSRVFVQGFLTNVLNPKVALFFLAFLPQFVAADASSKPLALLFLGMVFDLNGTLWNLTIAWSTARLRHRLTGGRSIRQWFDRCAGTLFVGIGIRLALSIER